MKLKFKHKLLIGTVGLAILAITLQIAMQFQQSYKLVFFVKRDQSNWISLYSEAKADALSCDEQLSDMKKARDLSNQDILTGE